MNKKADKSKGEIFPTIWYGSPIEVTTVQQAKMAKSVLIAEDPALKYAHLLPLPPQYNNDFISKLSSN